MNCARELIFRSIILLFFYFYCIVSHAQQFSVGSFKPLTNDITAYINPVKDLNKEACALIKVVGEADFVFSTPLGVVQRKEEVGEIWIYVPNGTVQITIKHPRWGVWRDYCFDSPLESRMTYELVLLPPEEVKSCPKEPVFKSKKVNLSKSVSTLSTGLNLSPPDYGWKDAPWFYLLLPNWGISKETYSWGIRMGIVKRHGYYLAFSSDSYSLPNTVDECDKSGYIESLDGIPYYSGKTQKGNWKILCGGIHRLKGRLCLYEGLGYGEKLVAWETSSGDYIRNIEFSTKGFCVEVGFLYHFNVLALSVGVSTIKGKYWEPNLGVGLCIL